MAEQHDRQSENATDTPLASGAVGSVVMKPESAEATLTGELGSSPPAQRSGPVARRRPGQVLECGWCGSSITVAAVGRTPKWCSDTCRHRAWETRRAAASATVPVRVVDRVVEVERDVVTVQQVEVAVLPKGPAWGPALRELARQVDTGQVYDRDLGAVAEGVSVVLEALARLARRTRSR